jgi:hypothetical protein
MIYITNVNIGDKFIQHKEMGMCGRRVGDVYTVYERHNYIICLRNERTKEVTGTIRLESGYLEEFWERLEEEEVI